MFSKATRASWNRRKLTERYELPGPMNEKASVSTANRTSKTSAAHCDKAYQDSKFDQRLVGHLATGAFLPALVSSVCDVT
ncbi:hypothetical protein PGTUg99_007688, partial [Puccinia graminis f. sp. tritici]